MQQLETHELTTKFVSSGVLSFVGDFFAQKIEHRMQAKEQIIGGVFAAALDKRRLVAMFVDGLICTGPLLHYIYEMYERILPTQTYVGQMEDESAARRRLLATLAHVLFDNFIMVFFYVGVLMVSTAMMEGRTSAIPQELRHDLLPAVKVSWKVSIGGYIPLQLLSFHYLPRKLRVLAVNVLDVVWVTVMSYMTHRNRH
ncbi:hypothetical protein ACHAXT_004091 [Thalassiosira profunda]